MNKLNDKLLLQFANTFYGYGSYTAPFWFLGMEEGGGKSIDEINPRFSVWSKRGKKELEDVAEYHFAIGMPELFNDKPKLQNTWNKQIRVLFGLRSEMVNREYVRIYQRDLWGRKNSDNCILDLFPLPSRNTKDWIYSNGSSLAILKNRKIYREYFLEPRINHIRQKIEEYNPKIVFIFGISYRKYWEKLVGVEFLEENDLLQVSVGKTKFVVLQHPGTKGIKNEYFYNVGQVNAKTL